MCFSPFVPFLFPQRARGTSEPSKPPPGSSFMKTSQSSWWHRPPSLHLWGPLSASILPYVPSFHFGTLWPSWCWFAAILALHGAGCSKGNCSFPHPLPNSALPNTSACKLFTQHVLAAPRRTLPAPSSTSLSILLNAKNSSFTLEVMAATTPRATFSFGDS